MTDRELQENVQAALDWEPSVEATEVGVTVDEGVVTLRGQVKSYREKETAEQVALRVYGVKGLANELKVHLMSPYERTDSDIAQAAVRALELNTGLPREKIIVAVESGWLTLKGTVNWQYQKELAAKVVRDLAGVHGVANAIIVQPSVQAGDVQTKIEAALKRSAEVDARRIHVDVRDGTVTLTGNVRSWVEREEAERAAWAAPGVKQVNDQVHVVP
jgi:osmotically-inducible protein OsmY